MIAITCTCGFSTKVPDKLSGTRMACSQCGALIHVGGPAPQANAAAPQTLVVGKDYCPACEGEIMPRTVQCGRCGFDKKDGIRKCPKCQMPIVHDDGPGFGVYQGAAIVILGLVCWKFIGPFGVGMIICAISGLSGLTSVMSMKFRCSACDVNMDIQWLSGQEKLYFHRRRMAFAVATSILLTGSLVCAYFWVKSARAFAG